MTEKLIGACFLSLSSWGGEVVLFDPPLILVSDTLIGQGTFLYHLIGPCSVSVTGPDPVLSDLLPPPPATLIQPVVLR